MEAAEQAYERGLIEKHQRFAVVDFALTKAGNKLAKLEPWCVKGRINGGTNKEKGEGAVLSSFKQKAKT